MQKLIERPVLDRSFGSCSNGYLTRNGKITEKNDGSSPGHYSCMCSSENVRTGRRDAVIGTYELKNYTLPALASKKTEAATRRCKKCNFHSEC